jgi:hypothetical protein
MGIGQIANRLALAGAAWLVFAPPTEAWAEKAVAFFTESHVDTKFPLSEIAGKAHSISFRFRLDYPNSMTWFLRSPRTRYGTPRVPTDGS